MLASIEQDVGLQEHKIMVCADMTSSIWKFLVEPGQSIQSGEPLVILEAMKMEFTISAPCAGKITRPQYKTGDLVSHGMPLLVIDTEE